MSERREGVYWVKRNDQCPWETMRFFGKWWANLDYGCEPGVIGPRIPTPDEDWVFVPREPTEEMIRKSTWSGNGDVSVSEPWARKVIFKRMIAIAMSTEDEE